MLSCPIAQDPERLDIHRKACNLDRRRGGGGAIVNFKSSEPFIFASFPAPKVSPWVYNNGCECAYVCVCFPFSSYFMSLHPISPGSYFPWWASGSKFATVTFCFSISLWLSCDIIHLFFILTFEGIVLSFTHPNVFRNTFDFPWMVTTAVKQYFHIMMFLSCFFGAWQPLVPIHFNYMEESSGNILQNVSFHVL